MTTHNDLVIRPFTGADTESLSGIWLAASRQAHPFIGEQTLVAQRHAIEHTYLPAAQTLVADSDGTPVGFISLLGDFVGGLFVAPSFQGQGIGRRLLAHAMAGRTELMLEVYIENRDALRFYLRQGFREISRRPVDDSGLPFENARLVWRL
ncbi:GNAT family N-acetyltransferase [Devosia sp.]|uniref:GNAT family N-acetyltransferase n=1 Tax=Devosia sp. TaxID=1871048 RepID=UPI003A8D2552